MCQKVIEESKNIHRNSKATLEKAGAKLNQLAKNFEQPIVRTIANHLGVTNTMRRYESNSTLPASTDNSQSDHSTKEPDSNSSQNSDTKTITHVQSLDDLLHPLTQDENTTMKSPQLQLEDLHLNELVDSPASSITSSIPSSITSSEMSDYSSQLESANQTQSTNSLGFISSTEATKSSSEYESDGDLRPKTRKKEIAATPIEAGFFNRKNNWPPQTDKATHERSAKEEPVTKGVTEPPTKKELDIKEETPELPAQEATEYEKALRRITGKILQKKI